MSGSICLKLVDSDLVSLYEKPNSPFLLRAVKRKEEGGILLLPIIHPPFIPTTPPAPITFLLDSYSMSLTDLPPPPFQSSPHSPIPSSDAALSRPLQPNHLLPVPGPDGLDWCSPLPRPHPMNVIGLSPSEKVPGLSMRSSWRPLRRSLVRPRTGLGQQMC